jgi:hypothetical protein
MPIRYAVLVAAVTTALIGVFLVFVLPSEQFVVDLPVPGFADGHGLLITTERAAGIALVWLASLLASRAVGRLCATRFRFPRKRVILTVTAVLALVGLYLVFVLDAIPTGTIGSFSFNSDGVTGRRMPFLLFLTTERVIGFTLVWTASIIAIGSLGQGLGDTSNLVGETTSDGEWTPLQPG